MELHKHDPGYNLQSEVSDDTLMNRLEQGDRGAFDMLYERYKNVVWKVVVWYLLDQQLAEDAAQETWVKIYQKPGTFNPQRGSFTNWVYSIAKNTCLKVLRAKGRTIPISSMPDHFDPEDPDDIVKKMDDEFDREHQRKELIRALNQLSELDRQIVALRLSDESDYHDIASLLKISESAARKRYSRALKKLYNILSDTKTGTNPWI